MCLFIDDLPQQKWQRLSPVLRLSIYDCPPAAPICHLSWVVVVAAAALRPQSWLGYLFLGMPLLRRRCVGALGRLRGLIFPALSGSMCDLYWSLRCKAAENRAVKTYTSACMPVRFEGG